LWGRLGLWTEGRILLVDFLGGGRAFAGCPRLPKGWPSWFAGAPKVASAPSGPGFGTLAGNLAQSLPQWPGRGGEAKSIASNLASNQTPLKNQEICRKFEYKCLI
jgi:hypothetical protein